MNGDKGAIESKEIVNIEDDAMSSVKVLAQVQLIQEIQKSVMKENEHYGVIPGCDKPSLLKPGAEKLSMTFRLDPQYKIDRIDLPNAHREYEVMCHLYAIKTGKHLGSGVGNCSTMETKYRYRQENTGNKVPKEYWDGRDQSLIGGAGYTTRKIKGQWFISHRVEYDNPADYYNTALKMAKKRAFVDAILTVTAASDIFTQDMEDMPKTTPPTQTTEEPPEPVAPPPAKEIKMMTEEQSEKIKIMLKSKYLNAFEGFLLARYIAKGMTHEQASTRIDYWIGAGSERKKRGILAKQGKDVINAYLAKIENGLKDKYPGLYTEFIKSISK